MHCRDVVCWGEGGGGGDRGGGSSSYKGCLIPWLTPTPPSCPKDRFVSPLTPLFFQLKIMEICTLCFIYIYVCLNIYVYKNLQRNKIIVYMKIQKIWKQMHEIRWEKRGGYCRCQMLCTVYTNQLCMLKVPCIIFV